MRRIDESWDYDSICDRVTPLPELLDNADLSCTP